MSQKLVLEEKNWISLPKFDMFEHLRVIRNLRVRLFKVLLRSFKNLAKNLNQEMLRNMTKT